MKVKNVELDFVFRCEKPITEEFVLSLNLGSIRVKADSKSACLDVVLGKGTVLHKDSLGFSSRVELDNELMEGEVPKKDWFKSLDKIPWRKVEVCNLMEDILEGKKMLIISGDGMEDEVLEVVDEWDFMQEK